MERSLKLKELLVNKAKIKLTPQEKLRIDKIVYTLEVWKKIFRKVSVVVSVKDFSADLPLSNILEIEVCTTIESFIDSENFSDKISIFVDENISISIGQHTFQNHSGQLKNVFDLWAKKFCPGYIFPNDFCLTKLLTALLYLEMLYKKIAPNLVNSNIS